MDRFAYVRKYLHICEWICTGMQNLGKFLKFASGLDQVQISDCIYANFAYMQICPCERKSKFAYMSICSLVPH